jgi:uncharacterized protein DUF6572
VFEHGTSNIERPTPKGFASRHRIGSMDTKPEDSDIKNRTGVIDLIAHDPKTNEVVLVMNEPNEWEGSDEQLLSLQERFNVYVSFLLDGEMAEAHPELAGKRTRVELRCAHIPDTRALELLGLIHDQLAFQDIKMEVVIRNDEIRMSNDKGMTKSE